VEDTGAPSTESGRTVGGVFATADGTLVRRCRNFYAYDNCNWLVPVDDPESLCLSCRLNQVIPNLDRPGNLDLWTKIERAKRRLLYTLLDLHLPLQEGDGRPGLRFSFMEDRLRNPDVREKIVLTGHSGGRITVNLAEADDAARHAHRELMRERYRTLLGHLRHEAGHHYHGLLTERPEALEEARRLFGDERLEYDGALAAYYELGPPADWHERYLSAYAAAHPLEDFAETFAHYLLIVDALETAESAGLASFDLTAPWIVRWMELSVTLNELNRSSGLDDAYPFVLTRPVVEKLELMDRLVRR